MKNIVHLTAAQWQTLSTTGSITVGGVTYTYDSDNEYCVQEEVDTTPTQNSANLVTSGGVWAALHELEQRIAALEG